MPKISPLAVVDPKAELADDVEVGPFCVIGPDVRIGAGTKLMNHVTIIGHTRFKAAQKLGLTDVPVHVARGLSPEKVKALRIA